MASFSPSPPEPATPTTKLTTRRDHVHEHVHKLHIRGMSTCCTNVHGGVGLSSSRMVPIRQAVFTEKVLTHSLAIAYKENFSLSLSYQHAHTHTHTLVNRQTFYIQVTNNIPLLARLALSTETAQYHQSLEKESMLFTTSLPNPKRLYKVQRSTGLELHV